MTIGVGFHLAEGDGEIFWGSFQDYRKEEGEAEDGREGEDDC
jgi:hypothetical protein